MAHLPWGDVREARIRAKFPRWGNWACFRNHQLELSERHSSRFWGCF